MHTLLAAFIVLLIVSSLTPTAIAVQVASPFTDHMVLQQGKPVPVWGTARPGEPICVEFGGKSTNVLTDARGRWRAVLEPITTGPQQSPQTLTVTGTDTTGGVSTVVIRDVLVGEVWICSGQSNMQFPLSFFVDSKDAAITDAHLPRIRMITVPTRVASEPQDAGGGTWTVCTPQTAGDFSAVGYYFARELHRELRVPVGMISAAWSGSPIEPWTPLDTLVTTRAAGDRASRFLEALSEYKTDKNAFMKSRAAKQSEHDSAETAWMDNLFLTDIGQREDWASGATNGAGWTATALPMTPSLNNYCGFVWYRTRVRIPAGWVGRELMLNLGPIDEIDCTRINGVRVGETRDTSLWNTPRHYKVPANAVNNQEVLITICAMNLLGAIGIAGTPADFCLVPVKPAEEDKALSLDQNWTYAYGSRIDVTTRPNLFVPTIPGEGWDVSTLWNAMIAPFATYAVRGAIWYQGESNAEKPLEYAELFPAMIHGWRKAWGQKQFDFVFVQLAAFMSRQTEPIEPGSWAELRDAQRLTLSVPDTGMAVALDIGDANDIHPRRKQEVARRLALWSLAHTYGRTNLVHSGPLYRDMTIQSNKVVVTFDELGGGLMVAGQPLTGFVLAGENKVFHPADAVMEGDTVVVTSAHVPAPVAVRYAWASNPICNLFNREGLPASSFRSDSWSVYEVKSAPEPLKEPVQRR